MATPDSESGDASMFSNITIPSSPSEFFELYGWYFLVGLLIYYFFWDRLKEKILGSFPTSNNNDPSRIPPTNDMRLHERRAAQQQRLDKLMKISQEKQQSDKTEKKAPPKLSKDLQKMKDSVAYRYATTGQFSKDDKGGSGGMADSCDMPRYRPPSAFQRYGRRPGGGGG